MRRRCIWVRVAECTANRRRLCMPGFLCCSNVRSWLRGTLSKKPALDVDIRWRCCRFSTSKCAKRHGFGMVHHMTALSHMHFVRRCLADLGPCADLLLFTGQKGCSRRSRAVIVTLFSDMHFAKLCAVFWHQGSQKGHRLRPTGRSVSGAWMHLQYERNYGLGMDGLATGCS